jgi:phosphoribosyl 1,2-cyclic phosphodiesterase
MRMMSIASGSSGNCIYIGSGSTHILIDDGISRKRVVQALNGIGLDISDLSAILVTHEHADHVDGLGVLLRKNNIPVYASKGTIGGIKGYSKIGKLPDAQFIEVQRDEPFQIMDLTIRPVAISHDAAEPLAYTVSTGNESCGVITDLGFYDDYIVSSFQNLNALLIESNHDIRMLEAGTYPYYLKRRILSDKGHLSNEASGRLLSRLLNRNIKGVLLGHLSHENNYPDLAYETVRFEVDQSDNGFRFHDFNIMIADRSEPSAVIEF